jgi:prevent-host-death family protein
MEIGLFEAKQKLSELVERASQGEEVIITRRGTKLARLVSMPAQRSRTLKAVFDSIMEARIKLPKGMTIKDLIEEGRGS